MTDKQPTAFTFHKVRQECEAAAPNAWAAFLNFYSPLFLHLASLYSSDEAAQGEIWGSTLAALSRNDFEAFRATGRQSEREFLVDVRAVFIRATRETIAAGPDAQPDAVTTALGMEKVAKIMEGLPLSHQEILWFKLGGYTDATIEGMMRTTPSIARGALGRLEPDFAAAREAVSDGCLWPGEWLAFLSQAQAAKKEECPPLHQLLRIHDGQVSWYDKEPMEKRVAGCLHCLESWAALREVGYWRGAAPPVPAPKIEGWLRLLPIDARMAPATTEKKKSLLRRVFG